MSVRTKFKTFLNNIEIWNPVLLMIGNNLSLPLQLFLFTRSDKFTHIQGLYSKPYSLER
jgi:hypothetical protein